MDYPQDKLVSSGYDVQYVGKRNPVTSYVGDSYGDRYDRRGVLPEVPSGRFDNKMQQDSAVNEYNADTMRQFQSFAGVDEVWDMMLNGTASLKNDVRHAMLIGSTEKFDEAYGSYKAFRDANIGKIRSIRALAQSAGQDDLVNTCDAWDTGSVVLDEKVNTTGQDGRPLSMTARSFMSENSADRKAVAAKEASGAYGLGKWSSAAFTDRDHEGYHVFDSLRSLKTDAKILTDRSGNPVIDNSLSSAIRTFGKFTEERRGDFNDVGSLASFVGAVVNRYGTSVGYGDLCDLSSLWKAERLFSPGGSVDDWLARYKDTEDKASAKRTIVTRDAKGNETSSTVDDPMVSRQMTRAVTMRVSQDLADRGLSANSDPSLVSGAINDALSRYARISRRLGPAASNEYSKDIRAHAIGMITGERSSSRLIAVEDAMVALYSALGYSYDQKNGDVNFTKSNEDVGQFAMMTDVLPRAAMELFNDRESLPSSNMGEFVRYNLVGEYLDDSADFCADRIMKDIPSLTKDDAVSLARRYLSNVATGRTESISQMCRSIGYPGLDKRALTVNGEVRQTTNGGAYRVLNPEAPLKDVDRKTMARASMEARDVAAGQEVFGYDDTDSMKKAVKDLAVLSRPWIDKRTGASALLPDSPMTDQEYSHVGMVMSRNMGLGDLRDGVPMSYAKDWIESGDALKFINGTEKWVGPGRMGYHASRRAAETAENVASAVIKELRSDTRDDESIAKAIGFLSYVVPTILNSGVTGFDQDSSVRRLFVDYAGRDVNKTIDYELLGGVGQYSFRPQGGIVVTPVELDDADADKFYNDVKEAFSKSLGVRVADPFNGSGYTVPKDGIGHKRYRFDPSGILGEALARSSAKASAKAEEDAVKTADEAARKAAEARGKDPDTADIDRPGASLRRLLSRSLSPDDRFNVYEAKMIRNLMASGYCGDDPVFKELVSSYSASLRNILETTTDFDTAETLAQPYLNSRIVYTESGDPNDIDPSRILLNPGDPTYHPTLYPRILDEDRYNKWVRDNFHGNHRDAVTYNSRAASLYSEIRRQQTAYNNSYGRQVAKDLADEENK